MAHIPDGVLSVPVLAGGAVLAAGGLALGLRRLDERAIPPTAILAATFFVVSLVAVPLGPTSVHPLLGGLMGLVLGWRAFPAVLVGLVLQAVLFGIGGLTSLGVNTVTMALPGILLAAAVRPGLAGAGPGRLLALGALVGGLAPLGSAGGVALALAASSSDYLPSLRLVALTYLPLAGVEAVLTALLLRSLARVRPDLIVTPIEVAP
ncbi:MAG: hypothetical protein RLZZ501_2758 [Pseudomonadota bacterium]|jgi:cobalt/nickel transport system permease protein